ncbi:unnamed protein product [Miscanthus lutarioriparius]|uniref:Uncharacterized protein n=1 Tax=Miscanthus lutarioriparius TaxID=422564 RepID=A0A811S9V1_9POAL|nr:unnamed protein product [Miscanthus lutarioriparius]
MGEGADAAAGQGTPPGPPALDPSDPPCPGPNPSVGCRGGGATARLVERVRPRLVDGAPPGAPSGAASGQPGAAATSSGLPLRQPGVASASIEHEQPSAAGP